MCAIPFLLLTLLTSGPPASASPSSHAGRLRLEPTVFVTDAGDSVSAELGRLSVPLHHDDADGSSVEIAFVRFRTTSSNPGYPIIYLAGGPGGSGIDLARGGRFPLFMALRTYGDVIALDQRGAGLSEPNLTCPEPVRFPTERALTRPLVLQAFEEAGARCAAYWRDRSVDLQAFNTEENADDLDDLRIALGADKVRLVGMSYGAHLALAAIRRHGARIDRAVLAGVEGPDHTLKSPAQVEHQLQIVSGLISADTIAGPRMGDLRLALVAILERLERQPATETITVENGDGSQDVTVTIGPYEVKALAAEMISRRRSIELIPAIFLPMLAGDFSVAVQAMGPARLGTSLSAMGAAMDCTSGASPSRRASAARESVTSLLGDIMDYPFPACCAVWGVRELSDEFRSRIQSEVPVLFLSGSLDPRTPIANVAELLPGFPRGGHLIIENVGHEDDLLVGSPEILAAIGSFIGGGPARSARLSLPAPRFVLPALPDNASQATVIRNVMLIDGSGGAPRAAMTVEIRDGRITRIAPTAPTDSVGARVVEGRDCWLIPGLWNMHVHLSKIGPSALPLLLANGITGVRDMGGDFTEIQEWRSAVSTGRLIGPRIFTPGPMLESPENVARMLAAQVLEPVARTRVPVAGPDRAAEVVDSLAALGVDFIKVRTFDTPATYRALGVAARRNHLKLVGHAVGVSPADLLAALPGSIEHYLYPTLETLSEAERVAFFRQLADAGTAIVPTLVVAFKSILIADDLVTATVSDTGVRSDFRRRYVSARLLDDWREQVGERGSAGRAQLQALLPALTRNMFEMRRAGMTVLPGTDAAAIMIYPGFSYHDELQLLQDKLQMTPMEILVSATRTSAEFLGVSDTLGTIAVGKLADLVLLGADPLRDISATRDIVAVIARGRLYDQAALRQLLTGVAVAATMDRLRPGR